MNKINETIFKNKKNLVLTIVLGLILTLMPLSFVNAVDLPGWFTDPLTGTLEWLGSHLLAGFEVIVFGAIAVAIGFGVFLSGVLSAAAAGAMTWMVTNCANIPIIDAVIVEKGWTFLRDFINMFFVLILVFIGLATILSALLSTIALSNLRTPKTDNHDVCAHIRLGETKSHSSQKMLCDVLRDRSLTIDAPQPYLTLRLVNGELGYYRLVCVRDAIRVSTPHDTSDSIWQNYLVFFGYLIVAYDIDGG